MMMNGFLQSIIQNINLYAYGIMAMIALTQVTPVFSYSAIPSYAKVAMSVIIGVFIAQTKPDGFDPGSLIEAIFGGALNGLFVGAIFLIAMHTIKFAGSLIGYSSQLGFATMVDPNSGMQENVIERLIYNFALLIFLGSGGIELMIHALSQTPTDLKFDTTSMAHFIAWTAKIYLYGFLIAFPIVLTNILINFGMASITKTAPSMNIFSIGFPIVILATLCMLMAYGGLALIKFETYFTNLIETI